MASSGPGRVWQGPAEARVCSVQWLSEAGKVVATHRSWTERVLVSCQMSTCILVWVEALPARRRPLCQNHSALGLQHAGAALVHSGQLCLCD